MAELSGSAHAGRSRVGGIIDGARCPAAAADPEIRRGTEHGERLY